MKTGFYRDEARPCRVLFPILNLQPMLVLVNPIPEPDPKRDHCHHRGSSRIGTIVLQGPGETGCEFGELRRIG